jgi:predicted dehydrogenase
MKILQIGCGRWGTNHMRVLRNLGVELFVADLSESERQRCLDEGLAADHVSADFNQFIEQVDAVDIVTPAQTHMPLALTAMAHKKDIFKMRFLAECIWSVNFTIK